MNNAGTNNYKYNLLPELDDNDIINIVETNVLGVMLCCREVRTPKYNCLLACSSCTCSARSGLRPLIAILQAIRVMREQSTTAHIFNMDGAGADGNATPRFAAYGASKRGLVQLGKTLQVCELVDRRSLPCFQLCHLDPALLLAMPSGHPMQAELKLSGVRNVCVHNLSPGMVTTELLMSGRAISDCRFRQGCA